MAIIRKNEKDEYIVVHHVFAESDVLDFLRMTSRTILDRLCFDAKMQGQSSFRFRGQTYGMTVDRGTMYRVVVIEDEGTEM